MVIVDIFRPIRCRQHYGSEKLFRTISPTKIGGNNTNPVLHRWSTPFRGLFNLYFVYFSGHLSVKVKDQDIIPKTESCAAPWKLSPHQPYTDSIQTNGKVIEEQLVNLLHPHDLRIPPNATFWQPDQTPGDVPSLNIRKSKFSSIYWRAWTSQKRSTPWPIPKFWLNLVVQNSKPVLTSVVVSQFQSHLSR